jgi:RNA polymerase sigma-70 factor (ECF subfamily)
VQPDTDWQAVVERLLRDDERAFLEIARLVSGFLARWRAYDFADEWDDVIQEVVLATSLAVRERQLRDAGALPGYVRSVTRHKFVDQLRARLRLGRDAALAWEERLEPAVPEDGRRSPELRADLETALDELPQKKRDAICGVYLEGKTYEQASREAGIPLGTLKRYLRDGLAQLRERLRGSLDDE